MENTSYLCTQEMKTKQDSSVARIFHNKKGVLKNKNQRICLVSVFKNCFLKVFSKTVTKQAESASSDMFFQLPDRLVLLVGDPVGVWSKAREEDRIEQDRNKVSRAKIHNPICAPTKLGSECKKKKV